MQYFKGDDIEKKFVSAGNPTLTELSSQKSDFFEDAFSCFVLGEVIFDANASPLANAIPRAVFREVFFTLYNSFMEAGSFEGYLTVFRAVFGTDVEVSFDVPAPGKLIIDIVATGLQQSPFVARSIVDDEYVFDHIVDDEGDRIVFQTVKGLESQYELEQMLFEMVPNGIYTQINLTIGGA